MPALIFDFDGVIADSEAIANTVLAEIVSDLGHSTTLDQALARYSGRRWDEAMAEIERAIGKPLPSNFSSELKSATLHRFRTDLKEVSGAANFIRRFSHIPRCIASSSSMDRLQLCLSLLGLEPPVDLRSAALQEVWTWAKGEWSVNRVPKRLNLRVTDSN